MQTLNADVDVLKPSFNGHQVNLKGGEGFAKISTVYFNNFVYVLKLMF